MEELDYYAVGQRIKRFRKARGLSQEQLAEMVDISTTHMSHIENANTKMSLEVFVAIAGALEVQTDAMLFDVPRDTVSRALEEVSNAMEGCNARQARVIAETIKALKQSMDAYL